MKKNLFVSLFISVLFISACSDSTVDVDDIEGARNGDNFIFHKNEELAEETEQTRSPEISNPFEIDKVWFEDTDGQKLMHIEVTQAEGCVDTYPEKFEIIWNGIMLMIYPPQVGLYLKFNSSRCSDLEENVKATITMNLYEILESEDLADDAVITVLNASKSSTENDYKTDRE